MNTIDIDEKDDERLADPDAAFRLLMKRRPSPNRRPRACAGFPGASGS